MRVAARLGYWGPAYHGYARQPDVDTVEGDLIRALRRIRAISDPTSARLAVASRTDRGVSALANVVAFDTAISPRNLPQATLGTMHDAWLWASVPVQDTLNPRHARLRHYRYHFRRDLTMKGLREAAEFFEGEHDFTSFTVGRVAGPLKIDKIQVRRDPLFIVADFQAERFARGLVRRIAGAMEAYARHKLTKADLRGALQGHRLRTPPADPEGLFLLDVDCGLIWPPAPERVGEVIRQRVRAATLAHRFAMEMAKHAGGNGASTP